MNIKKYSPLMNDLVHKDISLQHLRAVFFETPIQLTQEEIERMRAKRQEEHKAKKALTRLIIYAIYLSTLFIISYLERDVNSFNYKSNIENYMYSGGNGKQGFSSVCAFQI